MAGYLITYIHLKIIIVIVWMKYRIESNKLKQIFNRPQLNKDCTVTLFSLTAILPKLFEELKRLTG